MPSMLQHTSAHINTHVSPPTFYVAVIKEALINLILRLEAKEATSFPRPQCDYKKPTITVVAENKNNNITAAEMTKRKVVQQVELKLPNE